MMISLLPKHAFYPLRRCCPAFVAAILCFVFFSQTGLAAKTLCLSDSSILLLPQPEGGQTDVVYKPLLDVWKRHTDDYLAFSHRPGRGGSYAVTGILDAPADGCTLAAVTLPSLFLLSFDRDSRYRLDDVAPASIFATLHNALWVSDDGPFQNLDDLVAHMRAAVDNGDEVAVIAGVGNLSDQHLAMLRFERAAGVKGRYFPVLGSKEAADAVKNGIASACFAYALPLESMPGMKPLAVAGASRNLVLPDTPTMRELGVDMESVSMFGLILPAAVDQKKRAAYEAALANLSRDSEFLQALSAIGASPVALSSFKLTSAFDAWAKEARIDMDDYDLITRHRLR